MKTTIRLTRILVFYTGLVPVTMFFSIFGFLFLLFPLKIRYWFITRWSYFFIFWAKYILGLSFEVEGVENIPAKPTLVVANHQSTWETIFMQVLLPRQSWVLKRELLWIPFFGWGLALLDPISVNRKDKFSVKSLIKQGVEKLNHGSWILIYPEGTRVEYGKTKRFKKTAAALAVAANKNILPIAHNAGKFWPRGIFPIKSGTIKIKIGQVIKINTSSEVDSLTATLENTVNQAKDELA